MKRVIIEISGGLSLLLHHISNVRSLLAIHAWHQKFPQITGASPLEVLGEGGRVSEVHLRLLLDVRVVGKHVELLGQLVLQSAYHHLIMKILNSQLV